MKYILLFSLVFSFSNFYSQSNTIVRDKGLSPPELEKAKTLYVAMLSTSTFMEKDALVNTFVAKLPQPFVADNLIEDAAFTTFISENLQSSKFKSVEEAVTLRKNCAALEERLAIENAELYKFMQSATVPQMKEILKPTFEKNRQLIKARS